MAEREGDIEAALCSLPKKQADFWASRPKVSFKSGAPRSSVIGYWGAAKAAPKATSSMHQHRAGYYQHALVFVADLPGQPPSPAQVNPRGMSPQDTRRPLLLPCRNLALFTEGRPRPTCHAGCASCHCYRPRAGKGSLCCFWPPNDNHVATVSSSCAVG